MFLNGYVKHPTKSKTAPGEVSINKYSKWFPNPISANFNLILGKQGIDSACRATRKILPCTFAVSVFLPDNIGKTEVGCVSCVTAQLVSRLFPLYASGEIKDAQRGAKVIKEICCRTGNAGEAPHTQTLLCSSFQSTPRKPGSTNSQALMYQNLSLSFCYNPVEEWWVIFLAAMCMLLAYGIAFATNQ